MIYWNCRKTNLKKGDLKDMAKDPRRMKTYAVFTYPDKSLALDLINATYVSKDSTPYNEEIDISFVEERDTVYFHSKLSNISIGINVNTLAEFLNINRPDLFEPF